MQPASKSEAAHANYANPSIQFINTQTHVTLSFSAGLFDIRPDNLGYFEHLIDILKYYKCAHISSLI